MELQELLALNHDVNSDELEEGQVIATLPEYKHAMRVGSVCRSSKQSTAAVVWVCLAEVRLCASLIR